MRPLMLMARACVCFILCIASMSCSSRDQIPDDVTAIYLGLVQDDAPEYSRHYQTLYKLPGRQGPLTNVKPAAGVKYSVRVDFAGWVIPLAVNADGELAMPMRYFVTNLPFYGRDVKPWRPGYHVTTSFGCVYRFRLRPGERGLVFALVPHEGDDIWMYPADREPLQPERMAEKYVDEIGRSIRCVEVPALSSLPQATPAERQFIRSLVKGDAAVPAGN